MTRSNTQTRENTTRLINLAQIIYTPGAVDGGDCITVVLGMLHKSHDIISSDDSRRNVAGSNHYFSRRSINEELRCCLQNAFYVYTQTRGSNSADVVDLRLESEEIEDYLLVCPYLKKCTSHFRIPLSL